MVCVVVQHDDEDAIHAALSQLVPYAEEHGVVLLIESSGIFSSTSRLTGIMDRYASDYLGALWDVHNVYRVGGESPATTIKNLGAYVKHVHMRDSDDDGTFNLVGEGTLPIDEVVRALSSIDYDGFVSLEWDARVDGRPHRHGGHLPPLRQLHGAVRGHPRQDAARSTSITTAPASTCGRRTSSST